MHRHMWLYPSEKKRVPLLMAGGVVHPGDGPDTPQCPFKHDLREALCAAHELARRDKCAVARRARPGGAWYMHRHMRLYPSENKRVPLLMVGGVVDGAPSWGKTGASQARYTRAWHASRRRGDACEGWKRVCVGARQVGRGGGRA